MGFFAGTGFSISTLFLFWGIAAITKLLLPHAIWTAYGLVAGISLIAPVFLILSLDDPVIAFDHIDSLGSPPRSSHAVLWHLAYWPLGAALLVRLILGYVFDPSPSLFTFLSIAALGTIIATASLLFMLSNDGHDARVKSWWGRVVVGAQSIYTLWLVMTLP